MERLQKQYPDHDNFILLNNSLAEVLIKTNKGHIRHERITCENTVLYYDIDYMKAIKEFIVDKYQTELKSSDIEDIRLLPNQVKILFSKRSPIFFGSLMINKGK